MLEPPHDGWHDTGDIVTIDAQGFIRIKGRAKRFAKIGGEMVSLSAVEAMAAELWPQHVTVVVSVPDARKGERLVLMTPDAKATRARLPRATPNPRARASWRCHPRSWWCRKFRCSGPASPIMSRRSRWPRRGSLRRSRLRRNGRLVLIRTPFRSPRGVRVGVRQSLHRLDFAGKLLPLGVCGTHAEVQRKSEGT